MTKRFVVTEDHLKLLKKAYITGNYGELDDIPGMCTKKPFGNSSMEYDIAEILGWIPEDIPEEAPYYGDKSEWFYVNADKDTDGIYTKCEELMKELKIALQCLCIELQLNEGDTFEYINYEWTKINNTETS